MNGQFMDLKAHIGANPMTKATEKVLRGILLMYEHPRVAEQIKSKQLEGITQSEADDVLRAVSWARRNMTILENQKARQQ